MRLYICVTAVFAAVFVGLAVQSATAQSCQGPAPECGGITCSPVGDVPAIPLNGYGQARGHTTGCSGYFYTFALRLEDNQGNVGHYYSGTANGNLAVVGNFTACFGPRQVRSFFYIQVNGQSFYSYSPYRLCP